MASRTRPLDTPLVVIVGPTASGKTGLAVQLARMCDGEVISADSRQVYRELNIGTEKISQKEARGVTHHCMDIASPRRAYSVERWRACAERAILDIKQRGKVPIVAGGTGLYVDALVYGISFPKVPPNAALRRTLSTWDVEKLFKHLQTLDPVRAETVEVKNPRRLIRAIEVAAALGAVPAVTTRKAQYDVTWIGLNPSFETLEKRIRVRLKKTLRRGLVAETRMLHEKLGLSWKRINELGLEYGIVASYLRGEISKTEMEEKLYQSVRRYAKRQLRWLKRNSDITWYTSAENALRNVLIPRP